ncbi:hypothetical protein D3C71_1937150 [compost metagenome]
MRLQVAVDTVVGDVGKAVFIPLDRDLAFERGVLDLGIGLEPVDPFAVFAPELCRVRNTLLVPLQVSGVVEQRPALGRLQHRIDFGGHIFLPTHS